MKRLQIINISKRSHCNSYFFWHYVIVSTYHQLFPGNNDALDLPTEHDGSVPLPLDRAGVRKVDGGASLLHDCLDVAAAAPHHEQVVLRRNFQLRRHGDGELKTSAQLYIV